MRKDRVEELRSCLFPSIVIEDEMEMIKTIDSIRESNITTIALSAKSDMMEKAIHSIHEEFPDLTLIASDVTMLMQCENVVRWGIGIIMTPGYNEDIVSWCLSNGIAVIPGCSTASDIMRCLNHEIKVVNLFPAELIGNVVLIEEFNEAFHDVCFIPSGGIGLQEIPKYLKCKNVYGICFDGIDIDNLMEEMKAIKDISFG